MSENKIRLILDNLEKEYGSPKIALIHHNAHELLIATILSAQCTDRRVNIVTEKLFKRYPDIGSFAEAYLSELEKDIRSTGFYYNMAKNIINTSKMIIDDFNSRVPDTMEDLIKLSGVARKTANIVLSEFYGKTEGIAVDTHVGRLSRRLGLTESKNPDIIERNLMSITDRKDWNKISNLLITHGRNICMARNPDCDGCALYDLCLSKGKW